MNLKKFLWKLSGDDFNIILQCNETTKYRFLAIGGLVAVIFALCFVSCYFSFTMLFQNYFIGIPIGIFFAWMVTNIYLLLLYTLSKNPFPHKTNKSARFISVAIRLAFISFIAIVISKPIENLVFTKYLDEEIKAYKHEKLDLYKKSTEKYFDEEINVITDIISRQKTLNNIIDEKQLNKYQNLIQLKEKRKSELIKSMEKLVNKSNYYIEGIKILNYKYPFCWGITLIIVLTFLFPAYLKIFLDENTIYYKTKHYIENRLIKEEYTSFKTKYNQLFLTRFNQDIHFTELYIDPPFNTIKKRDKKTILKEDDLIESLYNA
ncbi:DUF4407 domain-containing protein [Sinomicrobium kalidii]|uniref:DUF4407 domain-containing protein n=1 Tax=Sinomicrobium kalidii TaxID=2900738 RepID=UPI001E4F222D|nr:DUF4407 domain-containing protein [Sinomicrobium kalidii]UGU16749.1 DUF4407 domain-containing protein [Sinomicrobium kalidii]